MDIGRKGEEIHPGPLAAQDYVAKYKSCLVPPTPCFRTNEAPSCFKVQGHFLLACVVRRLPPPLIAAARSRATATASRGGRPLLSSTLSHFVRFPGRMSVTFAAAVAARGRGVTFATGGVSTAKMRGAWLIKYDRAKARDIQSICIVVSSSQVPGAKSRREEQISKATWTK